MVLFLSILIHVGVIIRVLLRPHRDPSSSVAWILVILVLPILGVVA